MEQPAKEYLKIGSEIITLMQEVNNKKIEGWLAPDEAAFLYMMAQSCTGRGAIVEIGTWKGKSTIFLAKGSKAGNNIKIYTIDPHTGASEHREIDPNVWTYLEFKSNIQIMDIDDIVIPIVKTSEKAAKDWNIPIELLFIDGAHEYELVKLDFELWYPHVIKDGMVAMHDTAEGISQPGPVQVAKEYMISDKFYDLKRIYSLTVGRKKYS